MTVTFDPQQYKTTTRAQWEDAAEAWHRWGPVIEDWLGAATERMLDAAGVRPAAGCSTSPPAPAGRAWPRPAASAPPGTSLATDISPAILEYAAKAATDAGLTNVPTRELDGERLDVDEGGFDARHLPGRADLLPRPAGRAGRHARRPATRRAPLGGRVLDRRAQRLLRRPGRHHPPPRPAAAARARPARPVQPRRPGVAEQALADAGFRDVAVEAVPSPLRMASAADCVAFERESFGALHQMLAGLPEPEREAAWAEIGRGARRSSRGRTGSSAPARCSSSPAPARSDRRWQQ